MLALDNCVTKQGVELHSKLDLVYEHPFDSTLKRMAVVYSKDEGEDHVVYMKGATEVVFGCCRNVQVGTERVPMPDDMRAKIESALHDMSSDGLVSCLMHFMNIYLASNTIAARFITSIRSFR
jgi:magnesium-transporting ATPase (P-type)